MPVHLRTLVPPAAGRVAKRLLSPVRFRVQLNRGRRAHARTLNGAGRSLVFIAGLPKSGTSWFETMLADLTDSAAVMLPEANAHELRTGGSHDFDLPADAFTRLAGARLVLKMHVPGSAHNRRLLADAGLSYVVMVRDLRDVAVSHYFYVRRTPWHPEHPVYRRLSVVEGLAHFADTLLPAYRDWVRTWAADRDPQRSMLLSYETLLQQPIESLHEAASLSGLACDRSRIERVVQTHDFRNLSGGRASGDAGAGFYRKGVAGDWANHMTEPLKDQYKHVIGRFLIDFAYEKDLDW